MAALLQAEANPLSIKEFTELYPAMPQEMRDDMELLAKQRCAAATLAAGQPVVGPYKGGRGHSTQTVCWWNSCAGRPAKPPNSLFSFGKLVMVPSSQP